MSNDETLLASLSSIHKQVQWMADAEATSVWVGGLAAQGAYQNDKLKLLDEADRILDMLEGKNQ